MSQTSVRQFDTAPQGEVPQRQRGEVRQTSIRDSMAPSQVKVLQRQRGEMTKASSRNFVTAGQIKVLQWQQGKVCHASVRPLVGYVELQTLQAAKLWHAQGKLEVLKIGVSPDVQFQVLYSENNRDHDHHVHPSPLLVHTQLTRTRCQA